MIEVEINKGLLDELKNGGHKVLKYEIIIYDKYDKEVSTSIDVTIFLEKSIVEKEFQTGFAFSNPTRLSTSFVSDSSTLSQ